MKKILILAALLLSVTKIGAQSITINNSTSCTIYCILFCDNTTSCTPYTSTGPSSVQSIAPSGSLFFPDPTFIISGSLPSDFFTFLKIPNADPFGSCFYGSTWVDDCTITNTTTLDDDNNGCKHCTPNPVTIDWIRSGTNVTVNVY